MIFRKSVDVGAFLDVVGQVEVGVVKHVRGRRRGGGRLRRVADGRHADQRGHADQPQAAGHADRQATCPATVRWEYWTSRSSSSNAGLGLRDRPPQKNTENAVEKVVPFWPPT